MAEFGTVGRTGCCTNVTKTTLTSDTTIDTNYNTLFCNTDSGSFTVTLPEEPVDGQTHRIINCGSNDNDLIIDGNGNDLLGDTSDISVVDGDILILTYDSTEGWW